MVVLGLDLATKSGWAVDGETVCPPRTGTYTLHGGDRGHMFLRFNEWLFGMIGTCGVQRIVFEAPIIGGAPLSQDIALKLIGLAANVEMVAASRSIQAVPIAISTVRKHFLGHGRPGNPKKAVMARCKQLGWECRDDNAADAAACWSLGKARYDKTFKLEAATPLFAREGAA